MSEVDQRIAADAEIWTPAAILADLDGTLVDSVASSERAWGAFARRRGLDEEETHRFAMGRPTRETVALLVPEGERDAEQAQIDRDEVEDADSVRAYPGAAELLASPIPIAVVTSGSTELATARLRGAGLEPPAVLITADRIEHGKPDPEPFLLGARELAVDPSRCLALEDAPSGIESARAAGIPVVAFRTSHPEAELERASVVLDSLAEAVARAAASVSCGARVDEGSGGGEFRAARGPHIGAPMAPQPSSEESERCEASQDTHGSVEKDTEGS